MRCEFVVSLMKRCTWVVGAVVAASAGGLTACATLDGPDGAGAPAGDTSASELAAGEPAALDADFLETPGGRVHRSCIHEVPDGARVDVSGGVTLRSGETLRFASCRFAVRDARRAHALADATQPKESASFLTNGWFEYDAGFSPTNAWGFNWVNRLDAFWRVPPAPQQFSNQIVYLFPGIEPASGFSIIQPVLQWGVTPAGGGNFWGMAAWYVANDGTVLHSPLLRVSVGDTMEGHLVARDCTTGGACTWDLMAQDGGIASLMTVSVNEAYRWVQKGVLEAYRISNCNKLPVELDTGTTFFGVHVYQPGPSTTNFNEITSSIAWGGTTLGEGCSYGVIDTPDGAQLFWL
jgi:hypothetical protein